ncbi:hypothetical protein SUS17_2493 [Sphingomonas sp. S17]|nr:hypothetical protein SUS17_2493 [Sphingomonas sp. S17]
MAPIEAIGPGVGLFRDQDLGPLDPRWHRAMRCDWRPEQGEGGYDRDGLGHDDLP